MAPCCDPRNWFLFAITVSVVIVQGKLSTEDTHVVGYLSDTITLPCEHTVAKSNLESVAWTKQRALLVAEYDKGDDPPVSFYGAMVGRASATVFPSILKFSNGSLEDTGVYQCMVIPIDGDPSLNRYKLTINALPFNETIRLSGQSYQDCEKVYLSESTDALLSLSCTASSKPSSRLSWTADPATPALVVNQSIATECNTTANGVVTCERNATIVTKDLKDLVQVTCVTHFDDRRTVITSKRACVVLVPHGYRSPLVTVVVILVVLWLFGVVVVLIVIFLIWRCAKKKQKTAPVDLRHLAIGLGLAFLLPALGVAVFVFLTFYWKLLHGKKADSEKSRVEQEEQEVMTDVNNDREEGTNKEGEQAAKEEETAAAENKGEDSEK